MLAPPGQAVDALTAGIGQLLTTPGPAPAPQVLVLSSKMGLAGIGGYVGLNEDPVAELHARRLDAEVAIRIFANTAAELLTAEAQATRDVITADPVFLRQNGFLSIHRLTDRVSPTLEAADGIPAPVGRDLTFAVRFEHMPVPTTAGGTLGSVPLDITQAALSGRGGRIYANAFDTDPMGDFQPLDRNGGSGTVGNWSWDAAAQEVTQTGTTSGGNNGVQGNKTGTFLIFPAASGGAVKNFTLNAEMLCGPTGGIGFVFRFQDVENFGFVILENPAGVRVMGKRIAGDGTLLDEGGQDPDNGFAPDTWLRLRLLASDDRFELAINETTVLTGRDDALTQPGATGLFCRRADTARFRNFRLSSL